MHLKFIATSWVVLSATAAWAQTPTEPTTAEKLEELDQRQRITDRKLELAQEKSSESAQVTAGTGGFVLKSADGAFVLKFRGLLQVDGRGFIDDRPSATDTLLIRRARPIFDVTVFERVDFRLMPDFADGRLYDAYVDIRLTPWLKLRAGKFKPPIGLERLQSAANILFIERGFPTGLVPSRDLGVQLHGDIGKGLFTYALGIFNGTVDGVVADIDTHDAKDFAARVFTSPFQDTVLEGLSLGVAASYGRQFGSAGANNLPTFRSPGQQTIFTYFNDAFADGERWRVSPQLTYYRGPFGLLAEYVQSSQTVNREVRHQLNQRAWQAEASYVLTGEKAGYDGVTPKGQLGAFEIGLRYGELLLDPTTFGPYADSNRSVREAREIGAAMNWYLSKNARVGLNYERTDFVGGGRAPENAVLGRIQVSL